MPWPTDVRVPLVLDLQWVQQRRKQGGLIWVLDQTGQTFHADHGLDGLIGRDVPAKAPAAIASEYAQEAQLLLRRYFGRDVTVWLPLADDAGKTRWFRVDVHWINVFVVQALWPEEDAARHRVHAEPLDT